MIDTKEIRSWMVRMRSKRNTSLPHSVKTEHTLRDLCDALDAEREKVRVAIEALEKSMKSLNGMHIAIEDAKLPEIQRVYEAASNIYDIAEEALSQLKPEGENNGNNNPA